MSGYPHGLNAPPHGDALLRPGKDYELQGNEIVAVPNRTGGGMTTLREAAEGMVVLADMDRIPAPNACVWFNAFDRRIEALRAALAATADAPPEPTEEMVKRGAESLAASANRPTADWRRYKEPARWALRAALAVAQKEGE